MVYQDTRPGTSISHAYMYFHEDEHSNFYVHQDSVIYAHGDRHNNTDKYSYQDSYSYCHEDRHHDCDADGDTD